MNLRSFVVNFGGAFGCSVGANTPSFSIKFRARIQ